MKKSLLIKSMTATAEARHIEQKTDPMTPTTPTPALADLDKQSERESFINWSQVFHRNARSYTARDFDHGLVAWLARAALARRAAQPVAPVQAQPLKDLEVSVDVSTGEEDGCNRIFARLTGETGSDGTTLLAYEVSRNFATPSPQIAEVAELPPSLIKNTLEARMFVDEWHRKHFPTDRTFSRYIKGDTELDHLAGDFAWQLAKALEAMEARDAIAASRRAAGDEASAALREAAGDYANGTDWVQRSTVVAWLRARAGFATPAPASAGQAAPALTDATKLKDIESALLHARNPMSDRLKHINDALNATHALLAAQPSEGAGQAEAYQSGRQYQRKVDEKIIARRDAEIASLRAGQAGQVAFEPTDQQYVEWCNRHDLPEHQSRDAFNDATSLYLDAAPTERAAAPADHLDEAAAYRLWRDCEITEDAWFMQHLSDYLPKESYNRAPTAAEWDAAMLAVMQDRATHQPSAQKGGA